MKKSKNAEVQRFLEELKRFDSKKFKIVEDARKIVFEIYPDVTEQIKYGGILFTLERDFGGLFVYTNHISFEFTNGYLFKDPNKLLEGSGKYRRHIKLGTINDIKDKKLTAFIQQVEKY